MDHWPTSEESDHLKETKRPLLMDIMPKNRSQSPAIEEEDESSYSDGDDDDDAVSLAELTTSYGSGVDLHPHHKRRGGSSSSRSTKDRDNRRSSKKTKDSDADHGNMDKRRHDREVLGSERSCRRKRSSHSSNEEEDEYYHDEEGSLLSGSHSGSGEHHHHAVGLSSSRSQRRSCHSYRQRSRSSARRSPGICGPIFDGVNVKTLVLCLLGMSLITQLNKSTPPSYGDYGMADHHGSSTEIKPGVRGAMVNVNESYEEDDAAEEGNAAWGRENDDESNSGEQSAESVQTFLPIANLDEASMQKPPPPPPLPMQQQRSIQQQVGTFNYAPVQQYGPQQMQQQQSYVPQLPNQQNQIQQGYELARQGYYAIQQPVTNQFGYANTNVQPSSGFAVGQQSTYSQSPLAWQQQQMMTQQAQTSMGGDVAQQQQEYAPASTEVQQQPQSSSQEEIQALSSKGEDNSQQQQREEEAAPAELVVPLVPPPAPASLLGLLSNFKNNWDPWEKTDIPMFWHIPKAGGSSIKDAMGGCHRFVQATEFGVTDGHDQDTEIAIVYPAVPGGADTDRSPFVNIDSTTVAGIQRAKRMGFADAQLANVVVSPFVFETNNLFTPTAKGRLFSVFRHPIERAVSMFYYIRVADWEPSYKPELKAWTLEQYATSDLVENNWMTRQLSNQLGGALTEDNLKKAMEVVGTKFLVGLMSQIEPTMARCEKFFRWTYHVNPTNQEACRERLMSGGSNSNANNKKPLAEGDPAWDLLAHQNNYDLRLYNYIERLFKEQEVFVKNLPDNFRNIDATCCKCNPATYPSEGFTCPQAVKNA